MKSDGYMSSDTSAGIVGYAADSGTEDGGLIPVQEFV